MGAPKLVWRSINNTQLSSYHSYQFDFAPNIAVDKFGNIYLVYRTDRLFSFSKPSLIHSIVLIKLNSFGNIIWKQNYLSSNHYENHNLPGIATDNLGNVYIVYTNALQVSKYETNNLSREGSSREHRNEKITDIIIMKINLNGCLCWYQRQSTSNTCGNHIYPSITADNYGNTYISYTSSLLDQTFLIYVFKINIIGSFVWSKQMVPFNSNGVGDTCSIAVDNDGNCYIVYSEMIYECGYDKEQVPSITESRLGNIEIVVIKFDSVGNSEWFYRQGTFNSWMSSDIVPFISVDGYGNSYIVFNRFGTFSGTTFVGGQDIVVFKLNTLGSLQWVFIEPSLSITCKASLSNLVTDDDGNTYVVYETWNGVPVIVVFQLDGGGQRIWGVQVPSLDTLIRYFIPSIEIDDNHHVYVSYGANILSGIGDIVIFKINN